MKSLFALFAVCCFAFMTSCGGSTNDEERAEQEADSIANEIIEDLESEMEDVEEDIDTAADTVEEEMDTVERNMEEMEPGANGGHNLQ